MYCIHFYQVKIHYAALLLHYQRLLGSIPVGGVLGACSHLCVIRAHTLGGVGERAFLCGVCMFSLCPLG